MSRFWSPVVADLTPYVPGEQPKIDHLIKLNTNENPYGPSPRALVAMQAAVGDTLRLYPNPDSTVVRAGVANYCGIAPEAVFVGNGSDSRCCHSGFQVARTCHHRTPFQGRAD